MTVEEKKALYESIMMDVAKIVKRRILESDSDKQVVVFTGKSKYFEGDAVEKFIEKNTEFKTTHALSDKTFILITGTKPGPNKLEDAKKRGITVIGEDAFWKKYGLTDKLPESKA